MIQLTKGSKVRAKTTIKRGLWKLSGGSLFYVLDMDHETRTAKIARTFWWNPPEREPRPTTITFEELTAWFELCAEVVIRADELWARNQKFDK